MGRKKKFVNKTVFPDYAIERFTRSIYDDVVAFFATEEGRQEYEAWEAEQAKLKKQKKAVATHVAAALLLWKKTNHLYNQLVAEAVRFSRITRVMNLDTPIIDEPGITARVQIIYLSGLLFAWPSGFRVLPYRGTIGKECLVVSLEINK